MDYLGGSGRGVVPRGSALGFRSLLLSLAALGLIYADHRTPWFAEARAQTALALYPLQRAASFPGDIADLFEHFRFRESLLAENRRLREAQLLAQARLAKLDALEAETSRMRELLAAATGLGEKVRIAEILATAQDPYRQQIVLNKGANDGVYRGQALVDAFGVLGQIIHVTPGSSVALLITDANHGIPVEINRTGLQTIALGRGDGQALSLPFLPGNADVKVGDLIVSSALGGRFPAGYPVGSIKELRHLPGEHFAEAIAFPSARLNQGRQVLLIWGENPSAELPAQPVVLPAEAPLKESRKPAAKEPARPPKRKPGPPAASAQPPAAAEPPAPAPSGGAAPAGGAAPDRPAAASPEPAATPPADAR